MQPKNTRIKTAMLSLCNYSDSYVIVKIDQIGGIDAVTFKNCILFISCILKINDIALGDNIWWVFRYCNSNV